MSCLIPFHCRHKGELILAFLRLDINVAWVMWLGHVGSGDCGVPKGIVCSYHHDIIFVL
jgi:hypothetical protein